MRSFPSAVALACLLLGTIAPALAGEPPPPPPKPPLDRYGFITDRARAEAAIAFRPFVPSAQISTAALLPPFHEDHVTSKSDGIGYQYDGSGHEFVLRQWPRNGGSIASFAALPLDASCPDTHAVGGTKNPRGVAWATPSRVYTLSIEGEPSDARSARALRAEWRRLVRRGACR